MRIRRWSPGPPRKVKALRTKCAFDFAVAAASTSLKMRRSFQSEKPLRKLREKTRSHGLTKQGYTVTTSHSNCFMVDTKRPSHDVILAMAKQDVYIGRPWPSWNTWVRVTVGTPTDMAAFQKTFSSVMNA